jgi:hypothetical protein
MDDRVHIGTLLWGLALIAWGVVVLGVGLDWWSIELADFRYAGPILIIIVGAVIVVGALTSKDTSDT